MADRVIVQNSIPLVDVTVDGEEVEGIAMQGEFTIDTRQYNDQVTPVITLVAYAAGDALGGKLEWEDVVDAEDGGGITIDALVVTDKAGQQPDLDLVLFNQDFTASTDNAVFDPSDADLLNVIAVIAAGAWTAFSDNAVMVRAALGYNGVLVGTSLYGQLVIRGAKTFASVSDISVRLAIRQD